MTKSVITALLVVVFILGAVAENTPNTTPKTPAARKARKSKASVAPAPAPAAPPPPVLPSFTRVTYEKGLLSIAAQNVTLREIMERVRESTGAWVEVPAFSERITVSLGPQPPADAIAALLEGSHLNYVIVGGADQGSISAIQVTPEPAAGSAPASVPLAASPLPYEPDAAAIAQARLVAATGGDEGVWDNAEPGVLTPAAQAATGSPALPVVGVPPPSATAGQQ
jgi:hypothetical protein